MKKECNTCKIEKELSEFKKDKRLSFGFGGQCKKCSRRSKIINYNPNDIKKCNTCDIIKFHFDFKKTKRTQNGITGKCTLCHNVHKMKQHFNSSSETIKKRKLTLRKGHLKRKFNISLEEYEEMLNKQNKVCLFCSRTQKGMALAVDHCHKTGKVRGLLCDKCNLYIGYINENIDTFNKIINYLK